MTSSEPVLVTGADGFIGRALLQSLVDRGVSVRGAVRREGEKYFEGMGLIDVGDIGSKTDWSQALADVKTVVHYAARWYIQTGKKDGVS